MSAKSGKPAKALATAEEVLEVLTAVVSAADGFTGDPGTLTDEERAGIALARSIVSAAGTLGGALGVEPFEVVAAVLGRVPVEALAKLAAKLRVVRVIVRRGTLTIGDGVRVVLTGQD